MSHPNIQDILQSSRAQAEFERLQIILAERNQQLQAAEQKLSQSEINAKRAHRNTRWFMALCTLLIVAMTMGGCGMSTQNKLAKLITRFEIGFDNETKADIDALKAKIDELTRALSVKNDSHGDRLLAAMQAEAANDAPVTSTPWENDLNRETVNDVDYLSGGDLDECVPYIDDVLDQPHWLSESVPQITQADMQLIFIKNLSETLIQRMHSMERFSEDDYAIGGDKLMAWDCLIEAETGRFALVSGIGFENRTAIINTFNQDFNDELFAASYTLDLSFLKKTSLRTITEAELPAFRAALEACYA